jgi:hypothetical protein
MSLSRDRLLPELAGLISSDIRGKPSAEGIADILWMARFLQPTAHVPDQDGAPADDWPAGRPGTEAGQDSLNRARLYPFRKTADTQSRSVAEVRVPAVSSLPDAPAIARALQPLKRSPPGTGEMRLAEKETEAFFGETGLIWPVLRDSRQRWLRADLVIDTSASMAVWHQTARELLRLLQHHGAFRDVRAWTINGDDPDTPLVPLAKRARGTLLRHAAGELAGPGGRRIVLVLTDAVGEGWRQGSIARYLLTWAHASPTAIVQVLPRRLWQRATLDTAPVAVRMRMTAKPPVQVADPPARSTEQRSHSGRAGDYPTWVPVIPLRGDWIRAWAAVIARTSAEPALVQATPVSPQRAGRLSPPADGGGIQVPDLERLRIFQQNTGSPLAVELAGYLAAAPLTLPIMRLVQHAMLPQSGPEHLAEVFLSGLLVRADEAATQGSAPDEALYEFRHGVREQLLGSITRRESLLVLEVLAGVSDAITRQFGGTLDFRALAPTDEAAEDLLAAASQPFARIAVSVLDGMGGKYSELAKALSLTRQSRSIRLSDPGEPRTAAGSAAGDPASGTASDEVAQIASEIRSLRRGWGLREDVTRRIGPRLRELAARSRQQAAPGATAGLAFMDGDAAGLRRRLGDELKRLAEPLPLELRTAVLAALALHEPTREMRTYEQRRNWFADQVINRVPRTAERRINKAQDLLAREVAAELRMPRRTPAITAAEHDSDAWYIDNFTAILLLDGDTHEAVERRRIVAGVDGLQEIAIAFDVPANPGEQRSPLQLELITGGELIRLEDRARSTMRYLVRLPYPLGEGESHEYEMRIRVMPGERMRDYYVFRPERRCDSFDVRVRFDRRNPPKWVRRVDAEDVYHYYTYDGIPGADERVDIDRTGEAKAAFTRLRAYFGFGLQWAWQP